LVSKKFVENKTNSATWSRSQVDMVLMVKCFGVYQKEKEGREKKDERRT
jgi:hypothetical protein